MGKSLSDAVVYAIAALILFGPVAAVLIAMRRPAPKARRELLDTSFAVPTRFSAQQFQRLRAGNAVELGIDRTTRQPVVVPEDTRCMNLINVGPVGQGKTLYILSTCIRQDLARADNAVVIFDSQRALYEPVAALCQRHGRRLVVFPDCGWNPLGGEGTAEERAKRFADLLPQILEIHAGSDSSHYVRQQQIFISKIIPLFERTYGKPMTLQELVTLAADEAARARLLADAGAPTPEINEYGLYLKHWSKRDWEENLSGLRYLINTLLVNERKWLYNQRDAPSLAACIEDKCVVLIREGRFAGYDRALGLMFMTALQDYVSKRDPEQSGHLIAIYLDEAYMYFNPAFPDFIASSRQKRAALHLSFQTFEQFKEYAEVLSSFARTWIIHGGLGPKDAQRVAATIGKAMYMLRTNSTSRTFDLQQSRTTDVEHMQLDYLLSPEELMRQGGDSVLVLTVEDRRRSAHRLVLPPRPLAIEPVAYVPPPVPAGRPPTVWEEASPGPSAGSAAPPVAARSPRRSPAPDPQAGAPPPG